jgi:hypothetical protein
LGPWYHGAEAMSDPEGPLDSSNAGQPVPVAPPPLNTPRKALPPSEGTPAPEIAPDIAQDVPKSAHRNQLHLWLFSFITYALVIVFTLLAIWSYRYLEDKTRREQNPLQKDGEPLMPHRRPA